MGGLASYGHERLYTLGVNEDGRRRIGMEREGMAIEWRIFPIRNA